ncbi:MAG: hypothetical protein ABI693_01830 [Bryobacteraceae bacterium]
MSIFGVLYGFSTCLLFAVTGLAEIKVISETVRIPAGGNIATVYCTGLTGIEGVLEGSGVPLPTSLGGVSVMFDSVSAPLLAVATVDGTNGASYQQVDFQVPYEAGAATPKIVQGNQSATIPVSPAPWGTFAGILQHGSDYRPVTLNDPPRAGEWIITYGSNFGDVDNRPQTGYPASAALLSRVSTLFLGVDLWHFRLRLDNVATEIPLEIGYLGLAPGKVGLYQLNFRMPDQLPSAPAWIHLQRIGYCNVFPGQNGNCNGIQKDSTDWLLLYQ